MIPKTISFPFLSFPFLSFPFLSFPFLSFPFLSFLLSIFSFCFPCLVLCFSSSSRYQQVTQIAHSTSQVLLNIHYSQVLSTSDLGQTWLSKDNEAKLGTTLWYQNKLVMHTERGCWSHSKTIAFDQPDVAFQKSFVLLWVQSFCDANPDMFIIATVDSSHEQGHSINGVVLLNQNCSTNLWLVIGSWDIRVITIVKTSSHAALTARCNFPRLQACCYLTRSWHDTHPSVLNFHSSITPCSPAQHSECDICHLSSPNMLGNIILLLWPFHTVRRMWENSLVSPER